jgi:hypothetical protein
MLMRLDMRKELEFKRWEAQVRKMHFDKVVMEKAIA